MQGTQVRSLVPHAAEQLSLRTTTTELAHLIERARVLQTTEPTRSGARTPQLERENSHATTREKPKSCNEEPMHYSERKEPACLIKDPMCCN